MSAMELGAQIPAWHWEYEAGELRDWVQGAEAIGFDWLAMTDHVLYAYERPDRPPLGPYAGGTIQHEVFTTLAYLSALTDRVVLQTTVLVLPQREPVLVAKQAAELDVLSGGRFRLGVGIGWQEPEFEGLGVPFKQRPSRTEEAVAVLRACWSEEPITYRGRYTTLEEMSMLPKPVTPGGPPLILGGSTRAAEERAARLADGWTGLSSVGAEKAKGVIERLRGHLRDRGRDVAAFPIQWATPLVEDVAALTSTFEAYRDAGVTAPAVTMPNQKREGKVSVDDYLRRLEVVYREVWPAVAEG